MSELPADRLRWLATHHGVITTRRPALARGRPLHASPDSLRAACSATPPRACSSCASAPDTLEQRCAVQCATHPAGFVTGPTAGDARRAATDAARRRRCTSPCATASTSPTTAGVRWRADHGHRDGRPAPSATASSWRHGHGWRSTSPPTSAGSTTCRSCNQLLARAAGSPWTTSSPSTTVSAIPPARAPVASAGRSIAARRSRRTTRTPRSCSPTRCAQRDVPVEHQARVIRRPAVGRSTSTSPCPTSGGASSSTSTPSTARSRATPPTPRGAASCTGWRGRSRRSASTTWRDPERLADELAGLYRLRVAGQPIRVLREGATRTRHSDCTKHSDGGRRSDGGDLGVAAEDVGEGRHDLAEGGVLADGVDEHGHQVALGVGGGGAQRRPGRRRPWPGRGRGAPGRGA